MFEQAQQRLAGQGFAEQVCNMAQEPSRRGQRKGDTRAVIGFDVPAVQGRCDLTGQHTVRGNQGGGDAIFGGLAQTKGDGFGLGAGGRGLDQRQAFGCFVQIAKIRPELDGKAVMDHLGLEPGRDVGAALDFLLEIRLDEGLIGEEESKARLDRWWAERMS